MMKITERLHKKQTSINRKHLRKSFLAMLAFSVMLFTFMTGSATHSPSKKALDDMRSDTITTVINEDKYIGFTTTKTNQINKQESFMIYPHDEIDPQAYAPLAKAINHQFGADVYIVKYPMNHFWLGINRGKDIANKTGNTSWHVVMHGNGGLLSQASLPSNTSSLIYLSSYPLFQLKTESEVMVVRGSLDEVNPDKSWSKKRKLFPKRSIVYEIPQGNFSYFADFGLLASDSAGLLSINEQLQLTLEYLEDFVNGL